jgi:hypothetical protein
MQQVKNLNSSSKKKVDLAINLEPKFDAIIINNKLIRHLLCPWKLFKLLALNPARWHLMKCHLVP